MNILTALYTIFIKPLELIFEVIFVIANRVINNPGIAIIALSLAVNFLVLPLYRRADAMQEEERRTQEKLSKWVKHIRSTFQGDERFMMLQTYYRQNDYRPADALKGSVSLLLEIPFFIAAYRFLSTLSLLQGVSFGPIADLGTPDGLIKVAGLSINLLPILMTLINIISGAIYTKGAPLKTKLQLYGMALIFLIFLYRSPAGLVFYWTLNNLFSLVKNIFYKLKNPKKLLYVLISLTGIALALYFAIQKDYSTRSRIVFIGVGLVMQLPLLAGRIRKEDQIGRGGIKEGEEKKHRTVFLLSAVFLALLTGFLIPSAVIEASPSEFVNIVDPVNPMQHILMSLCLAIGIFVVWFSVFYGLASGTGKKCFSELLWIAGILCIIDYLFFGRNLGLISSSLKFDIQPEFSVRECLLNAGVLLVIAALVLFIERKHARVTKAVLLAGLVAVLVMGSNNSVKINAQYKITKAIAEESGGVPEITLSKNGQNVIVLMMDRMVNYLLPYIFYEKPELYEKFDGFTYYPNTVSSAIRTNGGAPGLYGGYEYIASEMNKRSDEPLVEKNNEALKVMPVLFGENGFDVTVCDPSYANYQIVPDLSIYDDYPEIKTYITMGRIYAGELSSGGQSEMLDRNLFCYGIMKVCPVMLQTLVYDRGNYLSTNMYNQEEAVDQVDDGVSRASGLDPIFINSYNVLSHMSEFTYISDTDRNCFLMMSNDTAHSPTTLQEPEYEPRSYVDNREFDEKNHVKYAADGSTIDLEPEIVYWDFNISWKLQHYQVNTAALQKLGNWLDYLRENDVYDNTRIIVVSDHATNLELKEDMIYYDTPYSDQFMDEKSGLEKYDLLFFNCMLMVKDFNSTGFTTDTRFMVNADVPTIATDGLIEDPVNPFTGNEINSRKKYEEEIPLCYMHIWDIDQNNGNTFLPDMWFTVQDDIFDIDNWKCLGVY